MDVDKLVNCFWELIIKLIRLEDNDIIFLKTNKIIIGSKSGTNRRNIVTIVRMIQ